MKSENYTTFKPEYAGKSHRRLQGFLEDAFDLDGCIPESDVLYKAWAKAVVDEAQSKGENIR